MQTLVVDISTVALMLLAKRMSRVDTFQLWWKLSIFIWPVSGFEFEYVDGAPLLGPSNANLYTIQMYWQGRVGARKYTSYPFSHPATNHYKSWHIFVRTNHYKSWNIFVRLALSPVRKWQTQLFILSHTGYPRSAYMCRSAEICGWSG